MDSNPVSISKEDILIVDDSPDNLRILSMTLIERGYAVRCVKSGAMALIGIQTVPPDLILLDIRMPEMDGYETCQCIKANPQTRAIPIIFLSALDEALDKVKAFNLGGSDYITKPFQIEEVLARVEHQLTIQRLQNQLVQQNQQLQQEVREHQKTEAALRDAKAAAEAANHTKSHFLAQMSHELRTPLTAILGFSGLMQNDQCLSTEYQEYLTAIHSSSQHLLKLINDILKITQFDNSYILLNEDDFDFYCFLNTLEKTWRSRAASKGIQFTIERTPEVPHYIYSDEGKLHQILNNLLENAIRFTTAGSVILRVTIRNLGWGEQEKLAAISPSPSAILHFEIEDTGLGIAAHELGSLFAAFSQTETGRQSKQGIGLGLFLSRQLVQRLNGDISVSSKPGQGTTFSFSIQACLTKNIPGQLQPQSASQSTSQASALTALNLMTPVQLISQQSLKAEVTTETLRATMPMDWLIKLYQAAVRGGDRQILELIQEIPPAYASLAQMLKNWTENFQFHQIVALTRPIVEER